MLCTLSHTNHLQQIGKCGIEKMGEESSLWQRRRPIMDRILEGLYSGIGSSKQSSLMQGMCEFIVIN